MKHLKYTLAVLGLVSFSVMAQETATKNYVKTTTYQVSTSTGTVTDDEKIETITYYDGLGRPEQTRAKQAGGNKEDIITPVIYDGFGREAKQYLPRSYTGAPTLYFKTQSTLLSDLDSYYISNFPDDIDNINPNPFSEKLYDGSPLNLVLQQGAPGDDWAIGNDHEINIEYSTNTALDVKHYKVGLTFSTDIYTPSLSLNSTNEYPANTLTKTITKDENWTSGTNRTTEEFKDKEGRVILKRTYNNSIAHDTYYVYDDYGNLTYVLPPLSNPDDNIPTGTELNDLCYQYKYDVRNRLVEKKIPGKGWEYIIYNLLDQPIMTQDQNLKLSNDWLFTVYDAFGRVAYTGLVTKNWSRFTMQNHINTGGYTTFVNRTTSSVNLNGTTLYYDNYFTNGTYIPTSLVEVQTISYYDSYIIGVNPTETTFKNLTSSTDTEGLPTVTKVKVLETTNWITTVSYYDEKARLIYNSTDNPYLGATDIIESDLDFSGKPKEIKTTHQKTGNADIVTYERFEYDHTGRLLAQTQKVDNKISRRLVHNNYDGLGQLESKLIDNGTQDGYKDLVGVSVVNDEITKTAGNAWGNGGLATNGSFTGDGYVEYVIPQTNKWLMVGLSSDNTNASYNTIDYAIYHAGTEMKVYESGSNKGLMPTYQVGDVLKVERIGTTIYYKKNGITFYTSAIVSTGNLLGDIALNTSQSKIKDLKIVDNSNGVQTVDYTYNVRGWLKQINDPAGLGNDLFGFKLNYNTANHSGTTLYNGNIAETEWKTSNDNTLRWYKYGYDDLNRISYATDNIDRYSLGSVSNPVTYDKNGNIMSLLRKGHTNYGATTFGTMDNLSYFYDSGNKLLKVTDAATIDTYGFKDDALNTTADTANDYTYDANGNMLTDTNKNITNITYNHLNLPKQITFGISGGHIIYKYDATGVKLRKEVEEPGGDPFFTIYAGDFLYEQLEGESAELKFFNHAEGYVEPDGSGGYDYVYQYKDHLGNIRLSYSDTDGNGTVTTSEIREENNYYPFGLKHKGYNNVVNGTDHKYGFGGMEEQDELGLNWIDITARNYDPALGRWMNLDPLAESMRRHSPYNYAFDNPIFFIDPDGLSPAATLMGGGSITLDDVDKSAFGRTQISASANLSGAAGGSGGNNGPGESDASEKNGDCCGGKSDSQNLSPGVTPLIGENGFISDDTRGTTQDNIATTGTDENQNTFTFKKGKSVFRLRELTYFGAGEVVTGEFGTLKISTFAKGLSGQEISSSGFALGAGLGSPLEVFTATGGKIHLDQNISGNNLEELFSSTKFITVRSFGAVIKFTQITAFDGVSMKTKLWHANLWGGGVLTAGIQGARFEVNFTNKNK